MSEARGAPGVLDLVLDIGKTRSKLLVLAADGEVVAQSDHASATLQGPGWDSLDTPGISLWLSESLASLGPLRRQLERAVVSAHGAAFAAIEGDTLAWPVPDYEFEGFDECPADWSRQIDPFADTQSPDLPRGLNVATQFDWLERHAPATFARGQLLPWAQYWAWWLCGVAASEVSSLGCHTHLWNPARDEPSALAQRRGWAARLAPLRRAWDFLGPVRPQLAQQLGLPAGLRVHTGAHDSNACLARYLRSHPRMTLVTTGTWIVVMAPGAAARPLDASLDLLGNVSVRREPVPTGRFMGGRELQHLCAGAAPDLASLDVLERLLGRGLMALPGFEAQGGPFRNEPGRVIDSHGPVDLALLEPAERATLAALYAAQMTAWIIERLGGLGPTVLEGPFSHNPVYTSVLSALLPREALRVGADALEGTARGAWMLTRWTEPTMHSAPTAPALPLPAAMAQALAGLHAQWLARLPV